MKTKILFAGKMLGATLLVLLLAQAALNAQEKLPITTSSEEARELFIEGRHLFEIFEVEKSAPLFKKAVKLDPDFALAHLYLNTERTGGKMADQHLEKAIKLVNQVSEGEKHQILYAKAYQSGNEKRMKEHLETLLNLHPNDERVNYWMGMYFYSNGDYTKASEFFKKATEFNNQYAPSFNQLGYIQMRQGNMEEADKAFKKFMELLPGFAAPKDSYAEFLLYQGKFDESIKYYEESLKNNPKMHFSYKGLGDNHLFKGDYNLARDYYRKYGDHAPNQNLKYNSMILEASLDLHMNNSDGALNTLDKYIDLAKEKNQPFYKVWGTAYKGYILTETGQPEKGLELYRNAVKMAEEENLPKNVKENIQTLGQLWEFFALIHCNKLEEAEKAQLKCNESLTEKGTTDNWKMFNGVCGIMDIKKGNYEEAIKKIKKSFDDPRMWYYTGLAYEKSGDKKMAEEYYKKVTTFYKNSIELAMARSKALAKLKE